MNFVINNYYIINTIIVILLYLYACTTEACACLGQEGERVPWGMDVFKI